MASKNEGVTVLEKARISLEAYRERHRRRNGEPSFDIDIMNRVNLIGATEGSLLAEIDLGLEYSNYAGQLHGAAYALLFDQFTTVVFSTVQPLSMATPEQFDHGPPGGPSRNLNVTFLRPLKLPAKCRIHCKILQNGKLLNFTRAKLLSADGKKTYAVCEHHKITDPNLAERKLAAAKL